MAAPTYKDEILHVEGDQVVKRDEAGAMITHRSIKNTLGGYKAALHNQRVSSENQALAEYNISDLESARRTADHVHHHHLPLYHRTRARKPRSKSLPAHPLRAQQPALPPPEHSAGINALAPHPGPASSGASLLFSPSSSPSASSSSLFGNFTGAPPSSVHAFASPFALLDPLPFSALALASTSTATSTSTSTVEPRRAPSPRSPQKPRHRHVGAYPSDRFFPDESHEARAHRHRSIGTYQAILRSKPEDHSAAVRADAERILREYGEVPDT